MTLRYCRPRHSIGCATEISRPDPGGGRHETLAYADGLDGAWFLPGSWSATVPNAGNDTSPAKGNVNQNGAVDSQDSDAVYAAIRVDAVESVLDFDENRSVNTLDVTQLVRSILGTRFGDANQDGSGDFLTLSNNFGAEDASWSDGDFDGDGLVRFSDFLWLTTNLGLA